MASLADKMRAKKGLKMKPVSVPDPIQAPPAKTIVSAGAPMETKKVKRSGKPIWRTD